MKNKFCKIVLIYNYIIPAFLLNCIGIVMMQLIAENKASVIAVSWLEGFKDFSIVIGSLIIGSFIPKLGYKKSLFIAIFLTIIACVIIALYNTLQGARFFFILAGISFGILKVASYSITGLITENVKEHASFLSFLEGCFMVFVLLGFWLFSFFIHLENWYNIYWLLIFIASIGFILVPFIKLDEEENDDSLPSSKKHTKKEQIQELSKLFWEMIKIIGKKAIYIFLIITFIYVFIEQGLNTWLPTLNNQLLNISANISVQLASLFIAGIALGRLTSGIIVNYFDYHKFLFICISIAIFLLLITIYFSCNFVPSEKIITNWHEFPFIAYLIPIIGIFIGPIYPTLCSFILSSQPKKRHSSIATLIIIFSAIGGTIGSRILGIIYGKIGECFALMVPLIPLILLLILILPFKNLLNRNS